MPESWSPAAMAQLHGQCFAQGWTEDDFAAYRADPNVVCVTAPDGFALALAVLDEADLLTIVVLPRARGRGAGAQLLDALETTLRAGGIHRLHLEVAADNDPARALYHKAGFEVTGHRRGYYPRPDGAEDALQMSKLL